MLPGVCEKFKLNSIFLKYHQANKEYFYDNINFYCAYGSFPISIWDGGRVFSSYTQSTKEEIIRIRDFYESMGVKTRIVCTNPVLEEKHLTNTRASGSDEALRLVPPIQISLEKAIEFTKKAKVFRSLSLFLGVGVVILLV